VRAAVLLLAAAGCGRLGFGGIGDDGPPDAGPPPSIATLTLASATAAATTYDAIPDATLDLPASRGTTWLFVVSATLGSSTNSEPAAEARYLIDGVERGVGGTQNTAPALGGPWQHFTVIEGTDAPIHIAFELRDLAGGTATIRDLFAAAIPLPPEVVAGMQYGAFDPILTVSSLAPVVAASFSFTPQVPGPYLVLGLANASDMPDESDVYVQWRDSAGTLGIDAQLPRRPWQSMLSAWVVDAPTPTEYSLWSHGGSGAGSLQYIRWLALPLAAFPSHAYGVSTGFITTTLVLPTELATAPAPPASAASRFLFLATSLIGEACEGVPFVERVISFTAGTAVLPSIRHTTDNCATELTSGVFALLPTAPPSAAIAIASGNGKTVQAQEGTVVVLGLPR
jgi:hypothetical protein